MVIQVKIPFWRILILLWALPNIGSSFHGFQACKTSCISLKKAYVIKGWFWFSRKNWTIRFQKLDYPVFTGLTPPPWTKLTPSPFLSLPSLTHTRTTVRVTPRPLLVIPWFLRGILEFLGEINFPRTGVSIPPIGFFVISRYFHLILDLFAPWMDLKFLCCIVFIHVIDQSPAISVSFLG
jgi:hypothetical protein